MSGLYEILASAQHGEAIEQLSRRFGLTPQQTESAVAALLPAISRGLKQSTATPEGLGGLLEMMTRQQDLYDDDAAFGETGRRAGNDALGSIFGSKDVSRAVAAQAQAATGVGAAILKQMLPVVIGMILSGLLKGLGGGAQGRPMPMPQPGPGGGGSGGGLGDILGEIFRRGPGQAPGGGSPSPFPFPIPGGRGGPAPAGRGTPARDLKDLSDLSSRLPFAGGLGAALFGDLLEPGHDVDRSHEDNIARLFDDLFGARGRAR